MDKYAQADGRFVGKPGTPTGITVEGPALKGATNLVLGALDHRETAFHPRAFREIYKFIAGREPARIAIVPEAEVKLSGLVTGTPGGVQTNRPVAGASVEIYRVSPDTGERIGGTDPHLANRRRRPLGSGAGRSLLVSRDRADIGRIRPTTHFYRSPFPRSSDIVHLRAARPLGPADAGAGAVVMMSRPRGYFGLPRDVVLLDGKEPADVKPGVPTDSVTTLRLPAAEAGPSGRGAVQRGADRGAGLAGVGKQNCDRRVDLLAISSSPAAAFMAPGLESWLQMELRVDEHSRSLRHAGHASAAGAAEPAARARHMTAFGRMAAMRVSPIGDLGAARLRRGYRPGPLLRSRQLHPQHAGCDPACAGRQLRELHADAGRDPGVAPDAWRRPFDRGRPRLEAPAQDAGAGLYAARGDVAGSAHDRGDR